MLINLHVKNAATLAGVIWRKSSRSGPNGGSCVEVALGQQLIGVRDSKEPSGPALLYPARRWADFLSSLYES